MSPEQLRYCPRCRFFSRDDRTCPKCGGKMSGGEPGLIDKFNKYPAGVTWAIIAACGTIYVMVMAYHSYLFQDSIFNHIFNFDGRVLALAGSIISKPIINDGEIWRLVTGCFLHGGLMHIFFNCMALRNLGEGAEPLWGKSRYWVVFVLSGIGGAVATCLWNGSSAHSVGASGAILGILGLLLGASHKHPGFLSDRIRSSLWKNAGIILLIGFLVPMIDNAGHVGGFLTGIICGILIPPVTRRSGNPLTEKVWNAAALLTLILVASCMVMAFYKTLSHTV